MDRAGRDEGEEGRPHDGPRRDDDPRDEREHGEEEGRDRATGQNTEVVQDDPRQPEGGETDDGGRGEPEEPPHGASPSGRVVDG
ncbi:hypothetical protein AFE02nite_31920 [Actinotalea fermentans]|uniref:Uncharacterized protein n=1 Tax=Actinotalea fermentans TaxID=43671 RepID=A0A511Z1X4_9CELL|nr:hypothetical protein AFE02nite_31920 [Actinotalea fermentans]